MAQELELIVRLKYESSPGHYLDERTTLSDITPEYMAEIDQQSFDEDPVVLAERIDNSYGDYVVEVNPVPQDDDEHTYCTKPTRVKAIQWHGWNLEEIWDYFGVAGIYGPTEINPDTLILTTADGTEVPCTPGTWVMKDSKPDTFYPCNNDHFTMKYEQRN